MRAASATFMNRRILFILVFLLAPGVCGAQLGSTPQAVPINAEHLDQKRMDHLIRAETNRIRKVHNQPKLMPHTVLAKAAQAHAARMVEHHFFGHKDPLQPRRRTPTDRALLAGVTNPKIAENVAMRAAIQHERSGGPVFVIDGAAGLYSQTANGPPIPLHTYQSFAKAIVAQWMASPGHRANLLAREAIEIGCGVAFTKKDGFPSLYAVQVFQWYEPVRVGK